MCLSKFYAKRIGKILADSLDMFFVDINDLLEYNLVDRNMLDSAGKNYFETEQQKIISSVAQYENACIVCSFDLLCKGNNFAKLRENCFTIYLRFNSSDFALVEKKFAMYGEKHLHAYESEDLICKMQSDIVIDIGQNDEQNLKNIKKSLLKFCK